MPGTLTPLPRSLFVTFNIYRYIYNIILHLSLFIIYDCGGLLKTLSHKAASINNNTGTSTAAADELGGRPCVTKACVATAAKVAAAMDKTVDPCEDFYSYSCGGWEKTHYIDADRTSVSQFSVLDDENTLLLKQILEVPTPNATGAVAMAYTWYSACLDIVTNNADAAAIFKSEILPLFDLASSEKKPLVAITEAIGAAHMLNLNVLYYAGSGADDIDPTVHSLFIGQSGQ